MSDEVVAAPAAIIPGSVPTATPAAVVAAPLDQHLGVAPPAAAPAAPTEPSIDDKAGAWPTDWRERYSKEDAKKLEKLQRYGSPEAALDAMFAAQHKLSSGELKPVLKKDASPEELTKWREAHGVPETPGKYELKGIAIDDAEKPMFEELFKAGHETNQSHDQMTATAKAWSVIKQRAFEKQAEQDSELKSTAEDKLRAEWGPEFKRNMNLITGLLDGNASPQIKEKLLNGRLADGTPIGSSPDALKMLLGLALINNPTGVVVPGGNANVGQVVEDEIKSIESLMRTDRKKYNADLKMQERYRGLLEAKAKMDGRPLR